MSLRGQFLIAKRYWYHIGITILTIVLAVASYASSLKLSQRTAIAPTVPQETPRAVSPLCQLGFDIIIDTPTPTPSTTITPTPTTTGTPTPTTTGTPTPTRTGTPTPTTTGTPTPTTTGTPTPTRTGTPTPTTTGTPTPTTTGTPTPTRTGTPTPTTTGTPTPTPTPQITNQCLYIKIYKNGVYVDPSVLRCGDNIVLAVKGTEQTTMAHFRVNGAQLPGDTDNDPNWTETTQLNSLGEYVVNYTIPCGVSYMLIEAEIYANGVWY